MMRLMLLVSLVVFACLLPCLRAGAQVAEALRHFDEGNRRYAAGDYADALAAYEQAAATDYAGGALYHNMGNTYFRLDELGQAIRYYERARRLTPNHPIVQHSLAIARSRIEAPISTLPTPFWTAWWRRAVVRTGPLPFFLAGLAAYGVAVVLLGQRIWTGTRNPWHRRALTLSALLGLLLLAASFGASMDRSLNRQAVVVAGAAQLHATPHDTSTVTLSVSEGILLDVLSGTDTWLEVRLPNGDTGWLAAGTVADV